MPSVLGRMSRENFAFQRGAYVVTEDLDMSWVVQLSKFRETGVGLTSSSL